MPSAKMAIGVVLLILVIAAFGLLFSGGGRFPGGSPPVTTVTNIQYIFDYRNWYPEVLEYLNNNVSVFSVGEVIGVAGFGVKINSIQVLDSWRYVGRFMGDPTRTVIHEAVIADRSEEGEIIVLDEAKFVMVDVTFMRVSEDEIPKTNVVIYPGGLSILINPFLLLLGFLGADLSEERNLSILKIVVSFDGKWIDYRYVINSSRSGLNLEKDIENPIGWNERSKLLFIVPKNARDIEVVITLSPDCPILASGPLCQPGIPIARVKVS